MSQNPLKDFITIRVHTRTRKGTTLEALAKTMGFSQERLKVIMEGDTPTKGEAIGLHRALGGNLMEYRPFKLPEDEWWSKQAPEVQAEAQRMVKEATFAPERLLEAEKEFTKRTSYLLIAAGIITAASLVFAFTTIHRYITIRKDAYTWAFKTTGSRLLAQALVGNEEALNNIRKIQEIDPIIDTTTLSAADRVKARTVLFDFINYYKACARQYQESYAKTMTLMGDPRKWQYRSILTDPITGQPVDLSLPDGGEVNLPLLRKLVQTDLRTEQIIQMARAIASGEKDFSKIPTMDKWDETARQTTPPQIWSKRRATPQTNSSAPETPAK